jgi:GT2 family glycosyltransferase
VAPAASILFPTRHRRAYLAVALASVASQAAEHDAEIVVVEDGARDPETERLATAHIARYVATGAPRGLNVARNAAIDAAAADLLCFLDDDVAAWPGWLGAMLAATAANPDHEAFGGPIRARLEGTNLHACGREPLPVTTLDLGPIDRDADLVWGSNLTLRRAALERVGPFDPALSGPGDEEEWERRLRAAGGRIRYVAAAGVDHRRTGADARLAGLARAAWHRGRHARRFDEAKGTAPGVAGELRTLAGCVWHTGRYRCGNGIVLTAQTAGRLREAVSGGGARGRVAGGDARAARARGDARAWASGGDTRAAGAGGDTGANGAADQAAADGTGGADYLSGRSGILGRQALLAGRARDAAADAVTLPQTRAVRRAARTAPRRRVLVAGVARPELAREAQAIRTELARSSHDVALHLDPGAPGLGKWANLRATLAAHPPQESDWLLIVDDDVVLPSRFLDAFILVAERFGLQLAQPAHAFASHAAWPVTRRRPGTLARRTRFVEIGPVTALHADAYPVLLPFPELEMGWGLDAHWSAAAAAAGLTLGVVDATPIRHLRPIAATYPRAAAEEEAARFLVGRAYVTREQAAQTLTAWRTL